MKNKKLIAFGVFIACFLITTGNIYAQYATEVTITDIGNATLVKKMEQEASKLLTAFNDAFIKEQPLPAIRYVKDQGSVSSIWAISPLKCLETEIIERGYSSYNSGCQIRNIPIFLKDVPNEVAIKEIAINFDRDGNIYDIYFSISDGIYMLEAKDVIDLRRRLLLVDFTENYLTAYYRKDISLISKVLSDDVIVSGREINNIKSPEQSKPLPDTTREYLDVIKKIFAMNERIDFKLNEITLQQHTKYDHIFGLTFVQILQSNQYRDCSYLFLYIDFKNENEPLIKVRIWKPYEYGKEKYDLDDFI